VKTNNNGIENYLSRIEDLESRLAEAEGLIDAIKAGEVDAFAFSNGEQHEIFTLQSGDYAYRVMVENINEGAINLSEDNLVVYTNKGFYQMLGLSYEKVIGCTITDFIHPGSLRIFNQLLSAASKGQSRGEINLQAGNKTIPVYISLTSLQPTLPTVGMIVTDLSEKKQNEKDLEIQKERERKINESQKELQELVLQAPVAISLFEGEQLLARVVNKIALEVMGKKVEDVINQPFEKLFPELPGRANLYKEVFATGIAQSGYEVEITYNKKGTLQTGYFDTNYTPWYDSNGSIKGVMGVGVDVTSKVLAKRITQQKEKELQKIREQLELSIEAGSIGLWHWDVQQDLLKWSEEQAKIFGLPNGENISLIKQLYQFVLPEDRDRIAKEITGDLENPYHEYAFRIKRTDGEIRWVQARSKNIYNDSGILEFITGINIDITEQKLAEERLLQSQNELVELANAVPQLVWMADAGGRMVYYNDRITEFAPASQSEDGVWDSEHLVHPDDMLPTRDAWLLALTTRCIFEKEHRLKLRDGEYKWFLSRGHPQIGKQGELIKWYGTTTDIHAQKIHETQKDEFLKMVSHELKTPVTSIKGYVQLLLAMLSNEDNAVARLVKQPLQRIDSQVVRLGKLITGILDISRLEDGRMDLHKEHFRLDELLKETIQDMMFAHNTHAINIQQSFDCLVYADKNRMGQVIINLVTNAIKYSPENNKIEINLTAPSKDMASVSIKDFGVGIEKSEHHKIFQRFYQTGTHENQNYTGFGIGLYITAEIIHRHGGEITVVSTPGKGSIFTFTIPVTTKNRIQ